MNAIVLDHLRLAGDLAIGIAWALAGLAVFQWVETQARRRGTLEGL